MLRRMSAHVEMLAQKVARTEDAVGDRLTLHHGGAQGISDLQNLDYLRQSLEDLALLTAALSDATGPAGFNGMAQARAALRLADTRALLCPGAGPAGMPFASDPGGEVDLF